MRSGPVRELYVLAESLSCWTSIFQGLAPFHEPSNLLYHLDHPELDEATLQLERTISPMTSYDLSIMSRGALATQKRIARSEDGFERLVSSIAFAIGVSLIDTGWRRRLYWKRPIVRTFIGGMRLERFVSFVQWSEWMDRSGLIIWNTSSRRSTTTIIRWWVGNHLSDWTNSDSDSPSDMWVCNLLLSDKRGKRNAFSMHSVV